MGRVRINPKILKWAGEDVGYTLKTLPNSLGDDVAKWESGEELPTWSQLKELSSIYKRPSAFFFRKNPPKSFKIDFSDFRTNKYNKLSPRLNLAIRSVLNKRTIFLELIEDMNCPKVSFSNYLSNFTTVNDCITYIGNLLDLNHGKSFNFLMGKLNDLGILVFEANVDLSEMKVLSLYFDNYPIVLLNASDSFEGKVFSLFHVLVHLLNGESTICNYTDNNGVEGFSNSVAFELSHYISSDDDSGFDNLFFKLISLAYKNGFLSFSDFHDILG